VGGPTFWAVEQGDEVLKAYREFLPNAPRQLNGFFAYAQVPPAPPFPEELYLRPACAVVWAGVDGEDGARQAMAPLLDSVPLLHGVAPMPHAGLHQPLVHRLLRGAASLLSRRRVREHDDG
jgi:hypothetical protein